MEFDIPECPCYGCWWTDSLSMMADHMEKRHTVAAVMYNSETDRQLWALGLPSRSTACEENSWCKITSRQGEYHGGECIGDPEYSNIEDDLIQAGLPVGEELVAVLG